jgi:pimeloyl-ACP methyl ester carboxylesterase
MKTRLSKLPDGRNLEYAEYGDASGNPMLYFHGGGGCHIDLAHSDELCKKKKIRLIAINRPGIGSSDFQYNRCLMDWPTDIQNFSRNLGLERFILLGWSLGCPYVLACLAKLPHLISCAGIIGGAPPLDQPGAVSKLGFLADRILFPLAKLETPPKPKQCSLFRPASLFLKMTTYLPASVLKLILYYQLSSAADRALVNATDAKLFSDMLTIGTRSGPSGVVQDYVVGSERWDFDLKKINTRVIFWHGKEDKLAPMQESVRMAETLPNGSLIQLPKAGHFLLNDPTMLEDILTQLMNTTLVLSKEEKKSDSYNSSRLFKADAKQEPAKDTKPPKSTGFLRSLLGTCSRH